MLIIHVEDDDDLAELFELSFRSFGFSGEFRRAESLARAQQLLDHATELALVVTDMGLPDGTGLDVIRRVRAHTVWNRTPILVVSGDDSPEKLGLAYALGANSYVLKAARNRPVRDVVKALYDHWVQDVVPPPARTGPLRPSEELRRFVRLRQRHGAIYLRFSVQLASSAEFWLARALNQSNRANLLDFLAQCVELEPREVPPEMLRRLERTLTEHDLALAAIERELSLRPVKTLVEACEITLRLIALGDHSLQLRAAHLLFPVSALAASALLDAWVTNLEHISAWMTANVESQDVLAKVQALREEAERIREVAGQRTAPREPPAIRT